jgi:hypothetical protein
LWVRDVSRYIFSCDWCAFAAAVLVRREHSLSLTRIRSSNAGRSRCLPDFLHYGSGNVVVPDPATFRCWDSCATAEPIERCEHLTDAGFLLDTIQEPPANGGRPLNLSAKVESYAATCADDYDDTGYRSECEVMRCHYMGTALAQVCDQTGITVKPPCRSVCQEYINRLSLPHHLPLYNSTSSANTPADFTDCDSILPVGTHCDCFGDALC